MRMEGFGEELRLLRKEKGLTQEQIGIAIDVSKGTISAWELDKCEPTLSKLVSISKYFGVSLDYLAGLED